MNQLLSELETLAKDELGFARFGVARAGLAPYGESLSEWVEQDLHGSMEWFADTLDVRKDVTHQGMLEDAKSVIVVALAYEESAPDMQAGRVARYAAGRDYHNVISKRLKKMVRFLKQKGFIARQAVDTKPLAERSWAQEAGIGFIGKNSCLIIPGLGSHFFLGALVTNALLPTSPPLNIGCGQCRACLDACPTQAFVSERKLDAKRCISYLTIESRKVIPQGLAKQMGEWVYGCDICQDVCPFNAGKKRGLQIDPAFSTPLLKNKSADEMFQMDDQHFAEWSQGSAVKRAKLSGWQRNALIVAHNRSPQRERLVQLTKHPTKLLREQAEELLSDYEGSKTED